VFWNVYISFEDGINSTLPPIFSNMDHVLTQVEKYLRWAENILDVSGSSEDNRPGMADAMPLDVSIRDGSPQNTIQTLRFLVSEEQKGRNATSGRK
jgi:hypothetical protein